jgi:predicted nucleic acid-binding protein
MIVPDTSVWIDHIRNRSTPGVRKLRDLDTIDQIIIGDVVLTEVLQGARDETDAARLEADMRQFPIVSMVDDALAVKAARCYRVMRSFGFTVRKIADLYIGTFCIENSYDLLHSDTDYDTMEKFCGLRVLH